VTGGGAERSGARRGQRAAAKRERRQTEVGRVHVEPLAAEEVEGGGHEEEGQAVHLGFGRIVASETERPNLFADPA
jgi:hypothetical protein